MRIASALTAALAIAALGGLAVATIIDSGYHRLRDLEDTAASESAALTKLQSIGDSAEHVLAVTGLGLRSGNADLVSKATSRLNRLSLATRELGASDLFDDADERLGHVAQLIGDIVGEVESRRSGLDASVDELAAYDRMAVELDGLIGRLQEDAQTRADAARAILVSEARHRQRADPILLTGYSVSMALVLLALLRYVAAPVQRLTVKAEDAIELGHSFRPVRDGPREVKQLDRTIARLVGDLEAKVSDRTSELAEQAVSLRAEIESRRRAEIDLRHAIAAAEAASEAKSRFLSVMSHELRTPMNAILGTLSLLRDTGLESGQKTYVETARDSGQALIALLNDVIDMSKIASGGVELAQTEFDLAETLDQILSLFHPACCEKRIVLGGILGPDVPRFVRGDQPRIRQILTNLVGNAVKFTDRGHIHVRIDKSHDGGDLLAFSVKDTGAGIAAEDQLRVFTDFSQADPRQHGPHGGAGLGLAICRGLVDAMGGSITLSSKPDAGSEFRFTVPLVPSERRESPEDLELRRRLRQMHVVIAGSCRVLADSVRSIFDGWVASVEVATDAASLSRIVSNDAPGLTCIICGPPDRPAWHGLLAAARDCCGPQNMVAIVPCNPAAANITSRHGEFRAIFDRALKPLTLMRLACGYDVVPPEETEQEPVQVREASILLVEDSAANRLVAAAMLEKAGYRVTVAANGREALDMMSSCRPDLVLMDLQMPVIDGYDALAGIRAMPGRAGDTPVIALSANVMARAEAEQRQLEFDGYLAKPLSRPELLDTLAAALDPSKNAGRASPTVEQE